MKIYIVACIYDVDLDYLNAWVSTTFPKHEVQLIAINNNVKKQFKSGENVLIGSNSLYEFSAYYEGLKKVIMDPRYDNEVVLVINDTLFTKHNSEFFTNQLMKNLGIISRTKLPAIAGRLDSYNNICYKNPWSGLNGYISSFGMLINKAAIDIYLESIEKIDESFPFKNSVLNFLNWNCDVDKDFREFIISHLSDVEISTTWYQVKEHIKNNERLNVKGKCVFLEHFVSGMIAKEGIMVSIFPTWRLKTMNFLFEQLAKVKRKIMLKRVF
ncbi:Uncharacterised protein [Enterobacter hormaechei]|uniref:sugar polymerase n=1 Tax=Enterobacter hormaechei TaxID=158836 RepID=UPI000F6E17BB|nr:sugar polymerase [Enterobacter hormaechei]VEB15594.1 Uncharacterised protein [Enterobacter hormaechei]